MPPRPAQRQDRLAAQRHDLGGVLAARGRPRRTPRRSRPASGPPRRRAPPRTNATPRPARPSRRTAPAGPRRPAPARAASAPQHVVGADQSTYGASASAHSPHPVARTPVQVPSSSRPIPTHCEPWPGKTNTVLPAGSRPPAPRPRRRLGVARRPRRSGAASSSVAVARRRPPRGGRRATRCGQRGRGPRRRAAGPRPRPAGPAAARLLAQRRSDRADSTHGTVVAGRRVPSASASSRGVSGACSRITCALVPLIAERRHAGPARASRRAATARASVSSSTAPADQSTCAGGRVHVQGPGQHAVPHRHAPS